MFLPCGSETAENQNGEAQALAMELAPPELHSPPQPVRIQSTPAAVRQYDQQSHFRHFAVVDYWPDVCSTLVSPCLLDSMLIPSQTLERQNRNEARSTARLEWNEN
jgi:hypothetical protein